MITFLLGLLTVVIGYFLGNFSTGIVVSRLQANTDIREHGSGNAGTTNMLRVLGRRPAMWTLLGDVVKGLLAALIGFALLGRTGAFLGGASAVIGHDFPVLFGFKGGKGVATTLGALLLLLPWQMLVCLLCFALVVAISRYVSLGSIAAALCLMIMVPFTYRGSFWLDYVLIYFQALLLVFSHRENIKRLLAKSENRLDFSQLRKKISKSEK